MRIKRRNEKIRELFFGERWSRRALSAKFNLPEKKINAIIKVDESGAYKEVLKIIRQLHN